MRWDPAKEQIVGDAEATKLLDRPLRAPWKLELTRFGAVRPAQSSAAGPLSWIRGEPAEDVRAGGEYFGPRAAK